MPPPKMLKPQFSPYGRYLIDVGSRKDNPVVHDSEGDVAECISNTPANMLSRFDNIMWAISRGYSKCGRCFDV